MLREAILSAAVPAPFSESEHSLCSVVLRLVHFLLHSFPDILSVVLVPASKVKAYQIMFETSDGIS